MLRTVPLTALLLTALALAGCASKEPAKPDAGKGDMMGHDMMMMKGKVAFASLTPTQGNNVRGLFVFHEMDGQLMVHAKVSGLKPGAEHGIHVHEKGDCASTDGTSAGGHFNPDGKPHGPQTAAHHAGDMPALKADANGVADQKFTLSGVTVAEGPASVVGHAVIVHLSPDDYATQPTGNSGARIACGVIAAH
jgi:Cu-Zn family superoxide dismutase